MIDETKKSKVKYFANLPVDLPDFINHNSSSQEVSSIEGTNVVRVPFGIRFSKRKRPAKNQSIATLILPITSYNSPTPPPNVA